ncbi:hypothetical protein [Streptomyces sp. NPDC054783]
MASNGCRWIAAVDDPALPKRNGLSDIEQQLPGRPDTPRRTAPDLPYLRGEDGARREWRVPAVCHNVHEIFRHAGSAGLTVAIACPGPAISPRSRPPPGRLQNRKDRPP